jgi:hypothetical protein
MADETVPVKDTPPNYQQLSAFIPTQDMVVRFYNLFKRVVNLTAGVIDLDARVTVLENKAHGGIRKTTAQVIGAIGQTFVSIINYQSSVFNEYQGVSANLAAGTITALQVGNYVFNLSVQSTFDPDNNSSREFTLRLFNVTDNTALPNGGLVGYVGGYTAGLFLSVTMPAYIDAAHINKSLIIQINSETANFSSFRVESATFTMRQI